MESEFIKFSKYKSYVPEFDNEEAIKKLRKTNDKDLREDIILNNLKLTYMIASRYALINDFNEEELFSEAIVALINAVDTYDIYSTEKFSTYLFYYVQRRVLIYIESYYTHTRRYGYFLILYKRAVYDLYRFSYNEYKIMYEEPYLTTVLNYLVDNNMMNKNEALVLRRMIPYSYEENIDNLINVPYIDENEEDMDELSFVYDLYKEESLKMDQTNKLILEERLHLDDYEYNVKLNKNGYRQFKNISEQYARSKEYVMGHYRKGLEEARKLVKKVY